MSARIWIYQRMIADAGAGGLVELLQRDANSYDVGSDAVFAAKGLLNSPGKWPFVCYVVGNNTEEALGEGSGANRQYFEIWVHDTDKNLDYTYLDSLILRLRQLFQDAPASKTDGVVTSYPLETSRDLDDQEMGTICRYLRVQVVCAA